MLYRLSSSTYSDFLQQLRILHKDLVAQFLRNLKTTLFRRGLSKGKDPFIISTEKFKVLFAAPWSIRGKIIFLFPSIFRISA